jgi:hypothetical protein
LNISCFHLHSCMSLKQLKKHQSFSLLCLPKYSKALIQDPGS